MNRSTLPLMVAVAVSALAAACGGKTSGPSSSSQQASTAGQGDNEQGAASSGGTSAQKDPAPDCVYDGTGGGGSSGVVDGVSSCVTFDRFECSAGEKTIECTCSAQNGGPWGSGSCSCNGITFAFDCTSACSIGPAEYAKCGFPVPPSDPSSGVGSTSSSSGSGVSSGEVPSPGSSSGSGSSSSSSSSGG